MEEFAEADLLLLCPRCEYPLYGLPAIHHCPECGLPIDRRWRVYGCRLRGNTANYIAMGIMAVSILIGIFVFLPLLLNHRSASLMRWSYLLYLMAYIGVCSLWLRRLCKRPSGFIGVGPDGVTVYSSSDQCETYTWDRVGNARLPRFGARILLNLDGRPQTLNVLKYRYQAVRCVRTINDWGRIWIHQYNVGASAGSAKPTGA